MKWIDRNFLAQRMHSDPLSISEEEMSEFGNGWRLALRGLALVLSIVLMFGLINTDVVVSMLSNKNIWLEMAGHAAMLASVVLAFRCAFLLRTELSMSEELKLLSVKSDQACQEALGLCAVNAQAEAMRAQLVDAGRPLRLMHLSFMRKLSVSNACKKLHGVFA